MSSELKPGEKAILTIVVVGFALLVAYCSGPVDPGLPTETYDRDIIGGRAALNATKVAAILGIAAILVAGMLTYRSPYQSCVRAMSENSSVKRPKALCLRWMTKK